MGNPVVHFEVLGKDAIRLHTFYVEVEDLTAALDKITSLGGHRLMGPMDVPGGPSIALFGDPEGHVVGLVKARAGPRGES
jgi:predicted enzyme related to lactoylglutathione lyase